MKSKSSDAIESFNNVLLVTKNNISYEIKKEETEKGEIPQCKQIRNEYILGRIL